MITALEINGILACCCLWRPNLHSQLWQSKLGRTKISIKPIWRWKLMKLWLNRMLHNPPFFLQNIIYLYLYTYTYTNLRIFIYRRAKSILLTNMLALIANWHEQRFTVLNWRAVSHSTLIGQNNYICQNIDQITALESGQKLVTKTYFWPFCSKPVVTFEWKAK